MTRLGQGAGGPIQEGKDLKQFFGIAGRNAALFVDFTRSLIRKGRDCRADQHIHPHQRQPGIDQPCQRLEPWQAGGGFGPVAGKKAGLHGQDRIKAVSILFVGTIEQEQGVMDQPYHPPPGQIGCPAGPLAPAITCDPLTRPSLRFFPRITIP